MPSSDRTTEPLTAALTPVTLRGSSSGSESLESSVEAGMLTAAPSATVAVSLAATGASLRSLTARVKVALADAGGAPSSAAVTRMMREAGASASLGAPLNVRVVGLKVSHAGRAPPSSSIAV